MEFSARDILLMEEKFPFEENWFVGVKEVLIGKILEEEQEFLSMGRKFVDSKINFLIESSFG